jgi:hypothetical protein
MRSMSPFAFHPQYSARAACHKALNQGLVDDSWASGVRPPSRPNITLRLHAFSPDVVVE